MKFLIKNGILCEKMTKMPNVFQYTQVENYFPVIFRLKSI